MVFGMSTDVGVSSTFTGGTIGRKNKIEKYFYIFCKVKVHVDVVLF